MTPREDAETPALIAYPPNADCERTVSKTQIYEWRRPKAALRRSFVAQVAQISWRYKLAPETVNLPEVEGAREIQIFEVRLKKDSLGAQVLGCIDDAVPFPVVFELQRWEGDCAQTKVIAAYKRKQKFDDEKMSRSDYFETDWIPAGAPRSPMPRAEDMGDLYFALLRRIAGLSARSQETLPQFVERAVLARRLRRKIQRVESKMRKETQFNRKVEINRDLRRLIEQWRDLTQ